MPSSPSSDSPAFDIRNYVTSGDPLRLRLSGVEWIIHYLGPLMLAAVTAALLYFEHLNPPEGFVVPSYLSSISALLTLFAAYRRARRLRFISVGSSHSAAAAWRIVVEAASVAGWTVTEEKPGKFLRVRTALAGDGVNAGELITVLFDDGVVRINSINDPGDWTYLYSGSASGGNAEWLETTLEKGVWRYDPEQAEELATNAVPVQAAVILNHITEGTPPRFRALRGDGEVWQWIGCLVVNMAYLSRHLQFHDDLELSRGLRISVSVLLCVVPLVLTLLHSRFKAVKANNTDAENFRRVRDALKKGDWHINYEDEAKGIEARIPYSTPEEGEIGVFIFRNGSVYVNLFAGPDGALPSFRRSQRTSVVRWVDEVLRQRENPVLMIDSTSIPSDPFTAKEIGIAEVDLPVCKAYVVTSGASPRLRLHGERRAALFARPLWIMGGAVVAGITFHFADPQSEGHEKFLLFAQILSLLAFILSAGIIAARRARLRFTVVRTGHAASTNYRRVLDMCRGAGWTILRESPNLLIVAYRQGREAPEEMITIYFDGTDVYVNSINKLEDSRPVWTNDIELGPATYSAERNRENVERVIGALKAEVQPSEIEDP